MTGYNDVMNGYEVGIDDFTLRQRRIMIELARGSSIQTICQATGLTPPSVRAMISDICLFLGAPDPAAARNWLLDQLDRSEQVDSDRER
ncbi:hypothetical protein BH23CHL2_BH23CHL2_11540 [soil metagenome]